MAQPDFIIIGGMKCGSTTLYRWLETVGPCWLPRQKEPNYFCDDAVFSRGSGAYAQLFADAPAEAVTGEASISILDPAHAAKAANRIAAHSPRTKLVALLRDPVARLRSHYRHEVGRSRESRPFAAAIADESKSYVRRSEYARGLTPFLPWRNDGALLPMRFEDLFADDESGWNEILAFLELPPTPRPHAKHNVSAEKPAFSRPMLWLWESGLIETLNAVTPKGLRSAARRLLLRKQPAVAQSAGDPVPPPILERLRQDNRRLQDLLQSDRWTWPSLNPQRSD